MRQKRQSLWRDYRRAGFIVTGIVLITTGAKNQEQKLLSLLSTCLQPSHLATRYEAIICRNKPKLTTMITRLPTIQTTLSSDHNDVDDDHIDIYINHQSDISTVPAPPAVPADHVEAECTVREQDRLMPIDGIIRIMRKILHPHATISDDAEETIQECVSEYISFVTGEANEGCQREQRKTVTAEDVLWRMSKFGFDDYVEPWRTTCICIGSWRPIIEVP